MATWLTRIAIAMMILVGITMAGSLSASATPQVGQGEEVVITYYNNAQQSAVIGQYEFGCVFYSWGSSSSYHTTFVYGC